MFKGICSFYFCASGLLASKYAVLAVLYGIGEGSCSDLLRFYNFFVYFSSLYLSKSSSGSDLSSTFL